MQLLKKAQRNEGTKRLRKPATSSRLCALLANGERILFFGFTQKTADALLWRRIG
jgi:hypothetical protein